LPEIQQIILCSVSSKLVWSKWTSYEQHSSSLSTKLSNSPCGLQLHEKMLC